jgi:uncharacterized damage-inducible protein DinB
MHPDQAIFLLQFLLPQLKSEQTVTKKIISAVPSDRGDFKPHPKCISAFGLAWHIAVVEMWFLDAVLHRHFGETAAKPGYVYHSAHVAEWYDQNFGQRFPRLQSLSGEDLIQKVDFIGLRNDPAVAYLNIAIRHSVHHRGQLSTYLRAMGEKVPAIYVESADEPYPPDPTAEAAQFPPAF